MTLRIGMFIAFVTTALCAPIRYTFTGIATGTLGTLPFTAAPFAITTITDTDLVASVSTGCPNSFEVPGTYTVSVMGLPSATFTDSMAVGVCQAAGDIYFVDNTNPSPANPLTGHY